MQTIYSLMNNGQLLLTTDISMGQMRHHQINLLDGVRRNFKETLSIHQQAVDGYSDVIVQLQPDELHAFWRYEETLEEQMTGKRPYTSVPLPVFQDLVDLHEADLRACQHGQSKQPHYMEGY